MSGGGLRSGGRVVLTDPVTIGRLLEERLLRQATILRDSTLTTPVKWCHSLHDLERPYRDLGGVAVMAPEAELTPEVMAALATAGAAAVFVLEATEERWTGDQGDPVVLGVPDSVTPRALSEMVARLALAHDSHILLYAQEVHTALAHQLHRGAGVDAICTRMAQLSGCGIAIVASDLRLIAFDQGPEHWLDPTALGAALRPVYDLLAERAKDDPHEGITIPVEIDDHRLTAVVAPIELAERRDGWVVLVDGNDPPHKHDLAAHRVVVDQSATIIGTELLRVRGMERAEERARGNFVHALLHNRFSNHADLVARAAYHDFPLEYRYAVVVARSAGLIADGDSPTRLAEMAREAGRIMPVEGVQTLAAVVGDVLGVVRPLGPPVRALRDTNPEELRAYAQTLEKRLGRISGREVRVAFGRPRRGAEKIMESYREARVALDLRERLRLEETCGFDDLRVDSVLLELAQDGAGRAFADDILRPLQGDAGGGLLEVVQTYVEAGGNLNEAARRINVHRNTMLYKLNRISRLIQRDIRDADTQFTVWLALRLASLATTAEMVDRDLSSG
jgi:sugar diacid utilization regulator